MAPRQEERIETETTTWLVSGSVQGVGFRWFTRAEALRLGLVGWARNLPDGRVEVTVSGAMESVAAMGRWLERGPPTANVHNVEKQNKALEVGDYKTFNII